MYWPRSLVDTYIYLHFLNESEVSHVKDLHFEIDSALRLDLVWQTLNLECVVVWRNFAVSILLPWFPSCWPKKIKVLCNKTATTIGIFDVWHGMMCWRRNSIPVQSIVMDVCLKMRKQFLLSFPHKHSFYLFNNAFLFSFILHNNIFH